jgi:squalene cyclase
VDPSCLLAFEDESAFRTYHTVERNTSVSTNAHVLEVLDASIARRPELGARFAAPADKARAFLLDVQRADGSWTDKWHASPYYATSCAALALGSVPARTVGWLLENQRADGSWGIWCGTLEETAYALQILRHTGAAAAGAIRHGLRFLREADTAAADDTVRTPLWHSKELYSPLRVVDGLVSSTRQGAGRFDAIG